MIGDDDNGASKPPDRPPREPVEPRPRPDPRTPDPRPIDNPRPPKPGKTMRVAHARAVALVELGC